MFLSSFNFHVLSSGQLKKDKANFEQTSNFSANLYMIFNLSTWEPFLQIFLHDPNAFFYSTDGDVNTKIFDIETLKNSAYPRAVG